MMISCGHCKAKHDSVAAVRACSTGVTVLATRAERVGAVAPAAQMVERVTGRPGFGYVAERAWTQPVPSQPTADSLRSVESLVPAGRYAVEMDGVLKFYQIDKPTEGRWSGYTFVKVQASDETFGIRNRMERGKILAAIARDVQGAMVRYGLEIGRCGHCGRTLTNEESRAAGIGPVCRDKMGW